MPINTPILTSNTLEDWRVRLNDVIAYQNPEDLGSTNTFDIDLDVSCNKKVTLTSGATATVTFSNLIQGISGAVSIIMPPSGTKPTSYSFPAYVKWENGVAPTPTYQFGVKDVFFFWVETVGDSNGDTVIIGKYINNVV
jgi:hypothetical protein